MAEKSILAINPGSSSIEYAIFSSGKSIINAYYEHEGEHCVLTTSIGGVDTSTRLSLEEFKASLNHFLGLCQQKIPDVVASIEGVGIRLVAPGRRFLEHQQLNDELYDYLRSIFEQAPLHIGIELDQIDQVRHNLPNAPIFVISDSEFHKTLFHEARNYAIPKSDADKHDIYRFGYHGISVKSVVHVLREELSLNYRRIIVCHLGSGSSITAIRDWRSVDTSMGYSPLEGLVMATRSGNIDIEAAIELKRKLNFDDHQLIDYLHTRSGLLGLSEASDDIRQLLLNEESGGESSKFALDAMVYRIQSYIGAYHAVLGGLDAIVFTATAGERSAILRRRICESVSHLGIELDTFANDGVNSEQALLSKESSPVAIHVVPSNESAEIARQTLHLLANN